MKTIRTFKYGKYDVSLSATENYTYVVAMESDDQNRRMYFKSLHDAKRKFNECRRSLIGKRK